MLLCFQLPSPRSVLEPVWDKKASVRENFKAMGLASDPNADIKLYKSKPAEFTATSTIPKAAPTPTEAIKSTLRSSFTVYLCV